MEDSSMYMRCAVYVRQIV